MHEGHRKRMLERIAGGETLRDHELLEVLLYNCIPRKNTNEVAHRLLSTFGSLEGVVKAGIHELTAIEGVGASTAAYLKCIAEFASRLSADKKPCPKLYNFYEFKGYLQERFSGLETEAIDLYCLDQRSQVVFSKRYCSTMEDDAELPVEEINLALVSHHPAGLVIAHNHPNATSRPSVQDDKFTASMAMLCSLNNVNLRDHIIVGQDGVFSYFLTGKLEQIKTNFDVEKMMNGKPIL